MLFYTHITISINRFFLFLVYFFCREKLRKRGRIRRETYAHIRHEDLSTASVERAFAGNYVWLADYHYNNVIHHTVAVRV